MLHAAWYPARLYKYYVEGVERNKIIINEYLRLHLRLLFVMSEVLKALYTYMNRDEATATVCTHRYCSGFLTI